MVGSRLAPAADSVILGSVMLTTELTESELDHPFHDGATPADPVSVHLVTLGCARNEVDSEELAGRLAEGGFHLVTTPSRLTR